MAEAMAQSAEYLCKQGDVPVLDFADPSHGLLSKAAEILAGGGEIPITSILLYVPIDQLILELEALAECSLEALLRALQDYAYLFRGSFEPTRDTIDVLSRQQLDDAFAGLCKEASADDQASAAIVQDFLARALGLDVQPEVHLEPRVNAYDSVMKFAGVDVKQLAQSILTELQSAAKTPRLSAIHRLTSVRPSAVPTCPACARHMPPSARDSPGARLRCALPACGPCLRLAHRQLLRPELPVAQHPQLRSLFLAAQAKPSHTCAAMVTPTNLESWHDTLCYNEVFQKSSKNSNARAESFIDQLIYHHIRSFELDMHTFAGSFLWSQRAPARDWWMTHGTVGGIYESHQCDKLSEVLWQLKTFHDLFPQHEVITLFLNFVDRFGNRPQRGHRPEDVDALLQRCLGAGLLFTPRELKGSANSLQAGAKLGWPSLKALVGKFICVVVTGAAEYADAQDLAEGMTCFVAKTNITHADLIHRHNWVVFFDQTSASDLLARDIERAGFINRMWVESNYAYQQAVRKRAHHLATKSVNCHHNTWSRTHTPRGFPFLPFINGFKGFDTSAAKEPMRVLSLRCSTGDMWGYADNAVFACFEDKSANGQWVEYQWLASNANSHMYKWARAGVALRSSKDDDGAPYFSIVRPAQFKRPAEVQLRSHADGLTTTSEARSATAVQFKLRCRYNGGSTDCEGYYSDDGVRWRLIRSTTIPYHLMYHGLIGCTQGEAKGMDGTQYRFVFANLTKDGQPLVKADFPHLSELGMVYRTARLHDGFDDDRLDFEADWEDEEF